MENVRINGLMDELIDVLKKETALYEDILKLSASKTDIIVRGNVKELENMTTLEQTMVLRVAKLEDGRERLSKGLADELGLNKSDTNVTGFMKKLPHVQAERLKTCFDALSKTLGELKFKNALNSRLISNSLDYIDFSINLFASAGAASGNNYGNYGQTSDARKRNFFDMKL